MLERPERPLEITNFWGKKNISRCFTYYWVLKQPGEKIREHSFVDVDENSINFNFRQIASAKVHPLILPPINFQYPRLYCTPNVPFHPLYLFLPLSPSLSLSLSLSLFLSLSRLFWPVYGTFSFVLHTCPDTRVHTLVNAETLFCISNVAYTTYADDRQDADLPRKSEPDKVNTSNLERRVWSLARLIRDDDNEARKKEFFLVPRF